MASKANKANKTKPEPQDVKAYLETLEPRRRLEDGLALLKIFTEETGAEAVLWTGNMVGFGHYHYKYASGREGDAFMTGFAMRKPKISLYLYVPDEGREEREEFLQALGKCTAGVSCVYVTKLADLDENRLREAIRGSLEFVKQLYPDNWRL